MANPMTLDTDKVSATLNQISDLITEVQKKNTEFIALLEQSNQKANGKFKLTKTLEERIREEARNINLLVETADTITEALNRYADKAAEANDDSAFRV